MTAPLAVTMGDPAGVGPEIIAMAVSGMAPEERGDLLVVGDRSVWQRAAALVGVDPAVVALHEVAAIGEVPPAEISAAAGELAYASVAAAVALCQSGAARGIVTAPLNKAALHAAGHVYDGHTGLLQHLTGAASSFMLLASPRLSVIHVSTHVALAEAIRRATPERVRATIVAGHEHLLRLGIGAPRIAVAGLNPHAGEGGLFGDEERLAVGPGIEAARAEGVEVTGPLPGDTVFGRAVAGEFDLVVAQYHDQGHIPTKLIAFDETVNVSLGLPLVRTSVDHGTAFDIAWTGRARAVNLLAAIAYARRMTS
jgi:4-hydroxythreonine-4-phosphate dehydrogenase